MGVLASYMTPTGLLSMTTTRRQSRLASEHLRVFLRFFARSKAIRYAPSSRSVPDHHEAQAVLPYASPRSRPAFSNTSDSLMRRLIRSSCTAHAAREARPTTDHLILKASTGRGDGNDFRRLGGRGHVPLARSVYSFCGSTGAKRPHGYVSKAMRNDIG